MGASYKKRSDGRLVDLCTHLRAKFHGMSDKTDKSFGISEKYRIMYVCIAIVGVITATKNSINSRLLVFRGISLRQTVNSPEHETSNPRRNRTRQLPRWYLWAWNAYGSSEQR